jgi:amicoumacin kinase
MGLITVDKYHALHLNPTPANDLIKLAEKLDLYHKSKKNYGLIHADVFPENFFITNDGSITIFDR